MSAAVNVVVWHDARVVRRYRLRHFKLPVNYLKEQGSIYSFVSLVGVRYLWKARKQQQYGKM